MLGKSRVKYIQSLGQKKFRDQEGLFIAEGPKIVAECLHTPDCRIHALYAVDEWLTNQHKLPGGLKAEQVTTEELEKISQLKTPNQVLAILEKPAVLPAPVADSLCLALDDIQDPGNLGTIIRIADWFGVPQVVCSPLTADVYNPKVIQSTMGSFLRVNVVYAALSNWIIEQQAAAVPVFAAALGGEPVSTINKPKGAVLLIGNESKGLDPALLALADKRIMIPRRGEAESLNAAVATGILLSHLT